VVAPMFADDGRKLLGAWLMSIVSKLMRGKSAEEHHNNTDYLSWQEIVWQWRLEMLGFSPLCRLCGIEFWIE